MNVLKLNYDGDIVTGRGAPGHQRRRSRRLRSAAGLGRTVVSCSSTAARLISVLRHEKNLLRGERGETFFHM